MLVVKRRGLRLGAKETLFEEVAISVKTRVSVHQIRFNFIEDSEKVRRSATQ